MIYIYIFAIFLLYQLAVASQALDKQPICNSNNKRYIQTAWLCWFRARSCWLSTVCDGGDSIVCSKNAFLENHKARAGCALAIMASWYPSSYIYIWAYVYYERVHLKHAMYVSTYTYIYGERDREMICNISLYIYLYIYICVYIERDNQLPSVIPHRAPWWHNNGFDMDTKAKHQHTSAATTKGRFVYILLLHVITC